jgi:hypothetical protein
MGINIGYPTPQTAPIPTPRPGGLGNLGGIAQPQQPSFLQSDNFGNVLQALGISLMGSPRNAPLSGFGQALQGFQQASAQRRDTAEQRAAFEQALIQSGMSPEEARRMSANPQAAKFALEQQQDKQERSASYQFFQQNAPEFAQLVDAGLPVKDVWAMYVKSRGEGDMTDTQKNLQWRAQQAGLQPGTPEYAQFMATGGKEGTNITVNTGEGDKFYENLDKKNAETFSALSEAGVQGRAKLGQIARLDTLLSTAPQGAAAMLKQAAGEYGIATEGLSDIQAAQALINELVPQQRQPGSGPMSDADLALFKQSLPRLINTPDGNRMIVETMRGITEYQIQMGNIADMVADREITPAEGRRLIRELKNPLEGFGTKIPTAKSGGRSVVIDGYTIEQVE